MRLLIQTLNIRKSVLPKMKRLLTVLIISFFMAAGCGLGGSKYDDAVLDGVSNLNRGKPEKAFEDFNRAIKIDPQLAGGYLGRANTLNTMGHYEKSIEDYDTVLEIDPKLANAYINRGSAYSHLEKYDKPSRTMKKAWDWIPRLTINRAFLNAFSAMIRIPIKVSANTCSI